MNTTKTWKRIASMLMALLLFFSITPVSTYMDVRSNAATPTTLYLTPGPWAVDNAWFAAYLFDSSRTTNTWVKAVDSNSDGIFEISVPSGNWYYVIFTRMKSGTTDANWDNKWNKTNDLTIPTNGQNYYTVTGWGGGDGKWGTYTPPSTTYTVTFSLTNLTKAAGASSTSSGVNYGATLSANTGYTLPDSITVKAGSTTLTSGTHYTYNKSTGAITINASAITGNITITASGTAVSTEDGPKIYLNPTGMWNGDGARFAAYFFNDSNNTNTWVSMTDSNGDGIYECDVPSGYPGVIFVRMNPSNTTNDWANKWNQTYNLSIPTDSKNCYRITGWGIKKDNGEWVPYSGGTGGGLAHIDEKKLDPSEVFYVDTDIVDYLNDTRVLNKQVTGYFDGNQGAWNNSGDSPFSYFNYLVGTQVSNGNQYTYPMYFGSLNHIGCRYGRVVGQSAISSLGNWHSSANVALTNGKNVNADAVVQGLVHNRLVDGTLADPVTQTTLLYFNKQAAEEWTNNNYKVMSYYEGLQFPFKVTYDENTRVTTYSYDSATDYAVYYDYANPQLYASNTKVSDTTLDGNHNADDYGFYPLNKPGDKDNQLNHGFGAKFNINFTVGENGKINGEDVTFDFTGDDDVWVFIDGVLVLDMGGAHSKATGSINFATMTATVEDACSVEGTLGLTTQPSNDLASYQGKGGSWLFNRNSEERANVTTGKVSKSFTDLGLEFDYGQTHTMTVFYMERAGIESNFSMEFTMVPVPSGLTLSKELNEKEINAGLLDAIANVSDYDFQFVATSPSDSSVAFQSFTLTHKRTGEVITVTPNGTTNGKVFSAAIQNITDYTYAHSFVNAAGDPAFLCGTQFNITESTKGIFSYSKTTWSVYDAKSGYTLMFSGDTKEASFTMGYADENKAYSYAVVFNNTLNLGNLKINKVFEDDRLADTDFQFKVYLDLDGKGSAFNENLYTNLVYTVDGQSITSADGSVYLKGGQSALISGIPAGATYRIVEVIPSDAPWVQDTAKNDTGSIATGATAEATFINVTKKHGLQAKMIFVEAGTPTNYTVTYDGQTVTITDLIDPSTDLNVVNNGTSITVTGANPNKVYYVQYSGRLPNGEIVYGFINVYTYSATHKTYVFDFGLSSNLADTTYGDGLFQGGWFINDSYTDTTATLISLTPNKNNKQTVISAAMNGVIGTNGSYSAITFSPAGFMSEVETYTYTVRITVKGQTYDASNPETGAILTGTIKVMPANVVTYEDNFNAGGTKDPNNKIIYSNNAPTKAPSINQSNDQSSNYGYDAIYNGGYADGAGSATNLTNGQYAYFTFKGTGFDLISRTNGSSAGFAVYVFAGSHSQSKLNFMNSFSGAEPADMVFVDTYYHNGDLHQVPVVSVRLKQYGEYTVYVQALATSPTLTNVCIDGIRIYNPLSDTSAYPIASEQNVSIDELRVLYGKKNIVSLAGLGSNGVFRGTGNPEVVQDALAGASIVEDMNGNTIESAGGLESIYLHGPNNEMYLPKNFGIGFRYTVTGADWTMQLGAKAVTASNTAKSITIYAKSSNSSKYVAIGTISLSSTTDMYYDLTTLLNDANLNKLGSSYDIIIISNSDFANNEFVSLTTVKYAGVNLG